MTEREELFLYHGIMIAFASMEAEPTGRIVVWLNQVTHDANAYEHGYVVKEIQEAIQAAERRFYEKN